MFSGILSFLQKIKNNYFKILVTGFALFSMFFGSGNLVIPLQIGFESKEGYSYAALGLLITGILVPFLGLFSVLVNGTTGKNILLRIGKVPGLILIFMMLALMGPFGVGPRCLLVAYGGIQLVVPQLPFLWFGLMFCGVTVYIIWNRDRFVEIIGRYLTPALLVGVFVIILFGLLFGDSPPVSDKSNQESFMTGVLWGYQTMDLLAAFFFSGVAMEYLKSSGDKKESKNELRRSTLAACIIGMTLLTVTYVGFVALGAKYATCLSGVNPEQMLTQIAGSALGVFAMPIMSVTVMLACLTTLVVLTDLFAEFLHKDAFREKIDVHWIVLATIITTFSVSLFGFKALAVWIGEALSLTYPAIIALSIASIFKDMFSLKDRIVPIVFYSSFLISVYFKYFA